MALVQGAFNDFPPQFISCAEIKSGDNSTTDDQLGIREESKLDEQGAKQSLEEEETATEVPSEESHNEVKDSEEVEKKDKEQPAKETDDTKDVNASEDVVNNV